MTPEGHVMSEFERLEDQLRRALEGDAWHGPADPRTTRRGVP